MLCGSPHCKQLTLAHRKQCLGGWGKGSRRHYYCTAKKLTDACMKLADPVQFIWFTGPNAPEAMFNSFSVWKTELFKILK